MNLGHASKRRQRELDLRAVITAILILMAAQTDFGVRSPPGAEPPTETPTRQGHAPRGMFDCVVRSVTDGDTFRCTSGVRVRLSSIDTPEMPGSCQKGRACASGNPYAARSALARLIAGKTVRCEPVGKSYNRIAAWCSVGGIDLSCAMVRSGHAIRLVQHDRAGRLCR